MSDRISALLKAAGLAEAAIGSLERGNAIFVLTPQTLLYQDDTGTRRVTLRDLTRVHSDQEGTLRVETPAGTALTASLLGFDPVHVQAFFKQVRDATAKAKETAPASASAHVNPPPTTPAPTAPASPASNSGAPSPGSATPATPPTAPAASATPASPAPTATAGSVPTIPPARPAQAPAPATPTVQAQPAPQPKNPPKPVTVTNLENLPPIEESVTVIGADGKRGERMVTQPLPDPVPAAAVPTKEPTKNAKERLTITPETRRSSPPTVTIPPVASTTAITAAREKEAAPALAASGGTPAAVPVPAATGVRVPNSAVSVLAALAAQAENANAWIGRLRFLGVFMLLAALALAYLLFDGGQGLSAVWTLIAGGMSSIALIALADLTKLLVNLSRAVSAEGGVIDVD